MNVHSALNPAGPEAAQVWRHFIFFVITAGLVCVAVIGALLVAARRTRGNADPASSDGRTHRVIAIAMALTVVILLVTLGYDFALAHNIMSNARGQYGAVIKITGHQWWWDVEYRDPALPNRFHTANEIHIPVEIGRA